MTATSPCPVPVLLLTFNRIETTRRVFEAVRQARPSKLYLASDGPRASRPEDAAKVAAVREFLTSSVDWPCEVRTLFQPSNLGCKDAPIAGISWLFENEEMGIVLEDDCLPHPDFFGFSADCLERFKDEARVYAVSGTNIAGRWREDVSGFFSMMGGNWGWASWRRAWSRYRADIGPELTPENWSTIARNLGDRRLYNCMRDLIGSHSESMAGDAWDYQWLFRRLLDGGLTVVPSRNLISNIGFGEDSTHTANDESPLSRIPTGELAVSGSYPRQLVGDLKYDRHYLAYLAPSFFSRAVSKLKAAFRG